MALQQLPIAKRFMLCLLNPYDAIVYVKTFSSARDNLHKIQPSILVGVNNYPTLAALRGDPRGRPPPARPKNPLPPLPKGRGTNQRLVEGFRAGQELIYSL